MRRDAGTKLRGAATPITTREGVQQPGRPRPSGYARHGHTPASPAPTSTDPARPVRLHTESSSQPPPGRSSGDCSSDRGLGSRPSKLRHHGNNGSTTTRRRALARLGNRHPRGATRQSTRRACQNATSAELASSLLGTSTRKFTSFPAGSIPTNERGYSDSGSEREQPAASSLPIICAKHGGGWGAHGHCSAGAKGRGGRSEQG